MQAVPLPSWLRSYQRAWLRPDVLAGVIVWSIVVPQAVAYAQIAGLPPQAGLMAAPGALVAYALLGTSRSLVVSATTATSAISAAAVGPLAHGDVSRYAALSAALALVCAVVLGVAGLMRLGAIADLVSKPVMTGFLFGLGLTIAIAQLPSVFGVPAGDGNFFARVADLLGDLGDAHGATIAVGAASIALLLVARRLAPAFPATLLLLVLAIAGSALLDLSAHGVEVVGDIPRALPDPSFPGVSAGDLLNLVGAALGVLLVSAEAIGVARSLATQDGYGVDANRDLVALGGSNLLAGLSQGFVQSGGASQTAAAQRAGGRSQLTSVVAAALVLLTGAFLAPLFKDLPQASLAAIVIVAISGFLNVAELRRFAGLRRSAVALSSIALVGVLALGVLQGLVVAAGLSLVYVVQRLSRPPISRLAQDPVRGGWGRVDRNPGWAVPEGAIVLGSEGPLLYANVVTVKERILALVAAADPTPPVVVLELSETPDLDVETLDTLGELADALRAGGSELRLAAVRRPAREMLRRGGLDRRVAVHERIAAALASPAGGDERSPTSHRGSDDEPSPIRGAH